MQFQLTILAFLIGTCTGLDSPNWTDEEKNLVLPYLGVESDIQQSDSTRQPVSKETLEELREVLDELPQWSTDDALELVNTALGNDGPVYVDHQLLKLMTNNAVLDAVKLLYQFNSRKNAWIAFLIVNIINVFAAVWAIVKKMHLPVWLWWVAIISNIIGAIFGFIGVFGQFKIDLSHKPNSNRSYLERYWLSDDRTYLEIGVGFFHVILTIVWLVLAFLFQWGK
jgi:hypothetical protein